MNCSPLGSSRLLLLLLLLIQTHIRDGTTPAEVYGKGQCAEHARAVCCFFGGNHLGHIMWTFFLPVED